MSRSVSRRSASFVSSTLIAPADSATLPMDQDEADTAAPPPSATDESNKSAILTSSISSVSTASFPSLSLSRSSDSLVDGHFVQQAQETEITATAATSTSAAEADVITRRSSRVRRARSSLSPLGQAQARALSTSSEEKEKTDAAPKPKRLKRNKTVKISQDDDDHGGTVASSASSSSSSSSSARAASQETTVAKKSKSSMAGRAVSCPVDVNSPVVGAKPKSSPHILRLMSWNVAGLRACIKRGFSEYLSAQQPDVLCMNEVKCSEKEAQLKVPGYHIFWNESKSKKGYAGTAILTKHKPLSLAYGIGKSKHDSEGRTITAEFADFYLVNTYVPNSGQKLERLQYRTTEWDADMLAYLQSLELKKPIIWTGDLNVAHLDIDIHDPARNHRSAGFTDEERANFGKVLAAGFIDVYRHLYPDQRHTGYTYWSWRFNAKSSNRGWRLDYFVISPKLLPRLDAFYVEREVSMSDHCPIVLDLKPPASSGQESN